MLTKKKLQRAISGLEDDTIITLRDGDDCYHIDDIVLELKPILPKVVHRKTVVLIKGEQRE